MFDNIGGKIKTLTQVLCWIMIISNIIGAIMMIHASDTAFSYRERDSLAAVSLRISGWILLFAGPLISWISSFTLYALGEITEKTVHTSQTVERIRVQMEKIDSSVSHCSEKAETASEEKPAYRPETASESAQEKEGADAQRHLIAVFDMYETHISEILYNNICLKKDVMPTGDSNLSFNSRLTEHMVWQSDFNRARCNCRPICE